MICLNDYGETGKTTGNNFRLGGTLFLSRSNVARMLAASVAWLTSWHNVEEIGTNTDKRAFALEYRSLIPTPTFCWENTEFLYR